MKTLVAEAGERELGEAGLFATVNETFEIDVLGGNDGFVLHERMSIGDEFFGTLTSNDLDIVGIDLEAGVTYEFAIDATQTSVNFPAIAVFGADEQLITLDDNLFDGVTNLIFTAAETDQHFLAVVALETLLPIGIPDNGAYRLTAEEFVAPDPVIIPGLDEVGDLAANDATVGQVEVGGVFKGFHGAADTDWIAVDLIAGQTVTIDVNGFGDTPVRDTTLTIFDENSDSIAFNDDFGFSLYSEVTLTADYTGVHYIQVETFNQGADVGAYQVRVFEGDAAPNGGGAEVLSNDDIATYLTEGFWADDVFTGDGPFAFDIEAGGTITVDLDDLTADGRFLAEAAFAAWTTATGLQFEIVSDGAMIIFDDDEDGAFSFFEELDGATIIRSIVNVSTEWLQDFGTTLDSYSFQTYIHEIGHAIGLGHAGDYNGFARFGVDNLYANDSWQATVMSYFSQTDNTTINADEAFVLTPMMADILAIEQLYGLTDDRRTGDTTYGEGSTAGGHYDELMGLGEAIAFTVVDDGGEDTIDFSFATNAQTVTLEDESVSDVDGVRGAMVIARGTEIEHFVSGGGDDHITGNGAANMLHGGAGDDTILGGVGEDTLFGGAGADAFDGGGGIDWVSFAAALEGVRADLTGAQRGAGEALGDTFADVENLMGGGFDDMLRGDERANVIDGGAGRGRLYGRAGDDTLIGGDDADLIFGGDDADDISGGEGADRLSGDDGDDSLDGGEGADRMNAGAGDDTARGGVGDDFIVGLGGADELYGQDGADTVFAGDGEDTIEGGDGNDRVLAGRDNDMATGGVGDDVLRGAGGDDTLDGGVDDDVLLGQAGNDELIGDSGDDTISGGANDDVLSGGAGLDVMRGETGDDILNGGADRDRMFGGAGFDTLNGDDGNDVLRGEEGSDSLSGGAGDDVVDGGAGNDTLFGGDNDDRLLGGENRDVLSGDAGEDTLVGGQSADTLTGGDSADRFEFAIGDGNDRILDFERGVDVLEFTGQTAGDITISANGADALVRYDGGSVMLEGVDAALLDPTTFEFG